MFVQRGFRRSGGALVRAERIPPGGRVRSLVGLAATGFYLVDTGSHLLQKSKLDRNQKLLVFISRRRRQLPAPLEYEVCLWGAEFLILHKFLITEVTSSLGKTNTACCTAFGPQGFSFLTRRGEQKPWNGVEVVILTRALVRISNRPIFVLARCSLNITSHTYVTKWGQFLIQSVFLLFLMELSEVIFWYLNMGSPLLS